MRLPVSQAKPGGDCRPNLLGLGGTGGTRSGEVPQGATRTRAWDSLVAVGARFGRRAMMLGTLAVTGCSFEPIRFVEQTQTPVGPTRNPARTVGQEFFERALDGSPKQLPEGEDIDLLVATPHTNFVLRQTFVGGAISAATMRQVTIDQSVAAMEGNELLAFTLQAYIPVFQRTPDRSETSTLEVAGESLPLEKLFDAPIPGQGWIREWEFVVLSIPADAEVFLVIEDQGQTVRVNLREGVPVDDAGWAANTGFRERWDMECEPARGEYKREFETKPPAGTEPDQGFISLTVEPTPLYSRMPWHPVEGWAPEGKQWLVVPMPVWAGFESSAPVPQLNFDVPASFVYRNQAGEDVAAIAPTELKLELILRRQTDQIACIWPVGVDESGTIRVQLAGDLTVDYQDVTGMAAEFTGEVEPLEFACTFTRTTQQ